MSTLIVLVLLVALGWIETRVMRDVVVTSTPIEQKYNFSTLTECQHKLKELTTQHNLSGLRCIPNEHNNSPTVSDPKHI